MTTPNSNYHTSSNAAAISKGRDSTEWTPLRLDTMGNSDPENGQTVTEEQKKGGEEEKEEEEKEPFCTKERIIKAFVLLGISIVNKLVAVNMIKIGVRNKDKCPAEDAIPKFMLVIGATCLVMFLFTILRNITLWPCFPKRLAACAKGYQLFVLYFVTYFLNFFLVCLIIAFSVFVFTNYKPEFEDTESPNYCHKKIYNWAFWVLISTYVVMAVMALVFVFRAVKKYRRKRLKVDKQ